MTSLRVWLTALAGVAAFAGLGAGLSSAAAPAHRFAVQNFRVVERESGPVNYYRVFKDADPPFIRAEYHPPYATTVVGVQVPDDDRSAAHMLS